MVAVFFVIALMASAPTASLAATFSMQKVRRIVFPVIGSTNYSNDFHAARTGHLHQGNDVFGKKEQALVAVTDGIVRYVAYPQPSYGYMVSIEDADGYQYWYLHINNDMPGTDDGRGGGMNAYAPGMESGAPVKAGQLIGWMGDSGNAETTPSHLHFELHEPDGDAINPYASLQAARNIPAPVTPAVLPGEIIPFGGFRGGASVAVGDVDPSLDGEEVIIGAAAGGGPSVAVYNGTTKLESFFAYPAGFRGGLDVASGDVNADGIDEIITASGPGGGGEVHVYGASGTLLKILFPYPKFNGEIRIAAADLDGDGVDEILTAPGRGDGPDVKVFSGDGMYLRHFFTYSTSFRGGIDIAAFSATETQPGGIVTVPLSGGGPHVKSFLSDGSLRFQFFPYRKASRAGVRLSAYRDAYTEQPVIVAVPGGSDNADIKLLAIDGTLITSKTAFETWWRGGYDIAATSNGSVYVSTLAAKRRAAVRLVQERRFSFHDESRIAQLLTDAAD